MEGGRGMFVVLCARRLNFGGGLGNGIVFVHLVRREGPAGFFLAQGGRSDPFAASPVCWTGVPYLLSTNLQPSMARRLELQFELRAPGNIKIPDQPDRLQHSESVFYTDNRANSVLS